MVAYSTLINMAPYSTPIKMYVSVLLFSLGPSTGLQTIVIVSMALYSTLKNRTVHMLPFSITLVNKAPQKTRKDGACAVRRHAALSLQLCETA